MYERVTEREKRTKNMRSHSKVGPQPLSHSGQSLLYCTSALGERERARERKEKAERERSEVSKSR